MIETILEILKYTVPALIVLIATSLIVKRFLLTDIKKKQLLLQKDSQEITIRLRLQACERLVLFVERINPRQLVPRIYQSGMNVSDLQGALVFNIKAEFEHNLPQQIYVSKRTWDTVKGVKEQMIHMIGHLAQTLNPEAPAKELHVKMIDFLLSTDGQLPADMAIDIINDEARELLSFGGNQS